MRWLRRAARQWGASSPRPLASALPTCFRFAAAREGAAFGRPPTAAIAALGRVRAEGGEAELVDDVGEVVEGLGGVESERRAEVLAWVQQWEVGSRRWLTWQLT